MPRQLKLIQISDLHLRADPDERLHGWHVENAWRRIADDALANHPDADLWVLSGDLVDDESAIGYKRLNAQLAALPHPVLALAGNHDDPNGMARHLVAARVHQPITMGGWHVYAINSHIDGSDAGRVGAAQLRNLRTQLQVTPEPSVICIHHPAVTTGSRWIDAIGLQDRDALCEIVCGAPHVTAVLCGHAHQALEARIGQAMCWITPSTMRQFRPVSDEFALDEGCCPGYRIVTLHGDGSATSRLHRATQCVDNSGDK